MIIYRQLGKGAEIQFSNTFGIGYALDQAAEWRDVFTTAFKAAFLVILLDVLRVTRNMPWCVHSAPGACRALTFSRRAHLSSGWKRTWTSSASRRTCSTATPGGQCAKPSSCQAASTGPLTECHPVGADALPRNNGMGMCWRRCFPLLS